MQITKDDHRWLDVVDGGLFAKEDGGAFEEAQEQREGDRSATFDACSDDVGVQFSGERGGVRFQSSSDFKVAPGFAGRDSRERCHSDLRVHYWKECHVFGGLPGLRGGNESAPDLPI